MTKRNTANADLHWDVLTITRPGLTHHSMLQIYPNFVNPGSLWGAANTAKPA